MIHESACGAPSGSPSPTSPYLAIVCWLRPCRCAAARARARSRRRRSRRSCGSPHSGAAVRAAMGAARLHPDRVLRERPTVRRAVARDRSLADGLGSPAARRSGRPASRAGRACSWPLLELVYMGCFLLIAAGFRDARASTGHAALADRYWTMVVGAEFGAFAPLAFVQTRPPWALERKPVLADEAIHDLAAQMVAALHDPREHVSERPRRRIAGRRARGRRRCRWPARRCFALALCDLRRVRRRPLSLRGRWRRRRPADAHAVGIHPAF